MKKLVKYKHIVGLLVVIILLSLCMFGCKSKDDKKGEKKDTVVSEGQGKEEDTNALPKAKQMAKDIDSFGANAIAMNSGTYTLKTSSIEITKAKEDAEQYVVYCTATQENDMFKASNSYKMTYNFYDIGGWVLDECVVEKIDMIPKTTITEEEARYYATGGHRFTSLTHTGTEKVSDTQYIFHYVRKYEYNYMDDVYNNDVVCTYDNSYGWYIAYAPKGSYHDWSKMYGTWYGENSLTLKATVTIKEVNEANKTIKYDVHVTRTQGSFAIFDSTVKEIRKNDIVAPMGNIDKSYLLELGLEYDSYQEVFSEIAPNGTTIEENFLIRWSKDNGVIETHISESVIKMSKIK